MANQQRDAEKERFWRKAIRRQAASGLAVRVFCRQEGLSEPSFYAWRQTIRERDGDLSQAPAFVPAMVSDRETGEPAIVMELVGGRLLKLPAATPAAWLAELLLALESQGPVGKELAR